MWFKFDFSFKLDKLNSIIEEEYLNNVIEDTNKLHSTSYFTQLL